LEISEDSSFPLAIIHKGSGIAPQHVHVILVKEQFGFKSANKSAIKEEKEEGEKRW